MATVGVVGIGRMGGSMARALATAGHDLVLWNRSPAAAETLAGELGARTATTPADVARAATVVISMLADGAAVDAAWGGPEGLAAGAGPDNVLVDCSTVAPATLRGHEAAVRATRAGILDAPVSGSVSLATSGTLTLMVGGTVEDFERARPILEALGKTIFHLGPLGSGAAMKLAVNTVIFGLNQALAEGLVLAEEAGIPREAAYDVLAVSAVGAPYVGYKRAAFLEPDTTPPAFALDLAAKDLGLITDLAATVDVDLPQARTNLEVIRAASAATGGDRDFSTVTTVLRTAAPAKEGAPT